MILKTQPELREEISESQEAIFNLSTDVGIAARGLFPEGQEIPYEGLSHDTYLNLTKAEIDRGAKVLYEPDFAFDQIFIKADILRKSKKGWDLYEVKASIGVKDVYIDDITLQYYVLLMSGFPSHQKGNSYQKKLISLPCIHFWRTEPSLLGPLYGRSGEPTRSLIESSSDLLRISHSPS